MSYDSKNQDGLQIYNLKERITDYVCPQIVQVFKENKIETKDIPKGEFSDDTKALVMFRGLEANEKLIGQTYEAYKKF